MATYEKNQLYQVPLAELQPDPAQPRKHMDPLAQEELTPAKYFSKNAGNSILQLST
jgi:hypothetical protein